MEPKPPARYSAVDRRERISERLRELNARTEELHQPVLSRTGRPRLLRSAELVRLAALHAAEAAEAAVAAYFHAAVAHEHAAALHDSLAETGVGDVDRHRRKAVEHRASAADDRARGGKQRH